MDGFAYGWYIGSAFTTRGGSGQRRLDRLRVSDRSEQGLNHKQRRLVIATRQVGTNGFRDTVLHEKALEVAKHRIAERRLHTDAGRRPNKQERIDAKTSENGIEFSLISH